MGEIVSSTGDLGLRLRGDNRIYMNWGRDPIRQASTIEEYFRRVARVRPETFDGRRDVFRGLVTEQVVSDLVDSQNLGDTNIEAAFPIKPGLWYLGMARNHPTRQPFRPVDEMVKGVRENIRPFNPPIEIIQKILSEGHRFITTLRPEDVSIHTQLLGLWANTFGWDLGQIYNLATRLSMQDKRRPSVWFSGIVDKNGILRAAAMAEMIIFKGNHGERIPIVESTEWSSTESDHIKAVVDQLHSQIRDAYPDSIIIAECNYHRGAHRAAQKSGMITPDVVIHERRIPQVLEQNVPVGDGLDPIGRPRDFILFVLPHNAIRRRQRRQILRMTM